MKLGLLPLLIACLIGGCCCDIGHQHMQPDPNVGASVECYAVNDDEYCFAEAKQLCPKGYVVDSTEIIGGDHKRLNFHCDPARKRKH